MVLLRRIKSYFGASNDRDHTVVDVLTNAAPPLSALLLFYFTTDLSSNEINDIAELFCKHPFIVKNILE